MSIIESPRLILWLSRKKACPSFESQLSQQAQLAQLTKFTTLMWPNISKLLLIPLVFSTSCVDPCNGRASCRSFVDSCPQNPSLNRVLGSFTLPINYIIRFDVKISNCSASQDHYLSVIEISEHGKLAFFKKK